MATEDLLVHNGRDGQTVEAVGEGFPQFDVVASLAFNKMLRIQTVGSWRKLTFIVKAVDPVDGSTLVVSS